jgi:signal transduction histidine kinase
MMVSRLGQARRQLVEQSYFSGMTEMASGVTHNIRNAMTPLIAHIDLMKEELKDLPLSQMEAAAHEISSADITAERLEMLRDFQKESFQYLTELVADFRVRLDGMDERAVAIERIIAGQERYAASGRIADDIDLEILVHDALALLMMEHFRSLNIEIDNSLGEIGRIKGPRNAMMYIFTNLLNNAAEAIIRAEREQGLIRISAESEKVDGSTFVHVMISDNGCGILKENLKRIFERGYSSKSGETSGIGLHWCANTMVSLRGRLYADSEGVNKGATIHLHIPQNPADLIREK